MTYTLLPAPSFEKHLKVFTEKQRRQVRNKLEILVENPMHPSLRVKRIRGTVGLWEMSVNMDIRVIMKFEGDKIIFLIDVGHHKILDGY